MTGRALIGGEVAAGPTEASARDFFAAAFVRFLNENFRSVQQVAAAFGVRERTAEYWLAGRTLPSGVIVAHAFTYYPESAARHLRLVVDNPAPAGPGGKRAARAAA